MLKDSGTKSGSEKKDSSNLKENGKLDVHKIESYLEVSTHQIFQIRISAVIKTLTLTAFILLLLSVAFNIYYHMTNELAYITTLFDFDSEQNIPTRFASELLIISSFLFFLVYAVKTKVKDKYKYHWLFLSIIFLIMSLDESIMLHEQTSQFLRGTVSTLHFAWVIPGAISVFVFALIYMKFFMSFETRWKKLFFLSAFLFFSGALGMEVAGDFLQAEIGQENLSYTLITNLEELLEISGAILLIYSLGMYIMHLSPGYKIELKK